MTVVAIAALIFGVLSFFGGGASGLFVSAAGEDEVASYEEPALVTEDELIAFAENRELVYWAGPMEGFAAELTAPDVDGSVYIRYLPDGVEAGDRREDFVSVATYPVVGAYELLIATAAEEGNSGITSQSGAIMVVRGDDDTRAYFAFPDAEYQVEVYSPDEGAAQQMVEDGTLVRVR